jgi:hypothetical protein
VGVKIINIKRHMLISIKITLDLGYSSIEFRKKKECESSTE